LDLCFRRKNSTLVPSRVQRKNGTVENAVFVD
jgi:hypothetical protein